MSIPVEFEVLREEYVAFYAECAATSRGAGHCATELLVQPNGYESPTPFSLVRIDIVSGLSDSPQIQRVADNVRAFDPVREMLIEGVTVRLESASWEEFHVQFQSESFTLSALQSWLTCWLDVAEEHPINDGGLSNVVHSLAWTVSGVQWELVVDFGSAAAAALLDFFRALACGGVRECSIGAGLAG
jgi:hypothetical protein